MSPDSRITFSIDAMIGRREGSLVDALAVACLILYSASFLTVRGATNACFFALLLLAIVYFLRHRAEFKEALALEGVRLFIAAQSALFFAFLTAGALRGQFEAIGLDAPVRLLLSGLLLCFFLVKRVRFVQVFQIGCPIALIAALGAGYLNPEVVTHWENRYATSFVDPNVLGSYAVILSFMTLVTLDAGEREPLWLTILKYAGIAAGLLLAMLAGSRGGWLAVVPLFALWIVFHSSATKRRWPRHALLVLAALVAGSLLLPGVGLRALRTAGEILSWLDGTNTETAPGQRLSIWKLGLTVLAQKPWLGFGIAGLEQHLGKPDVARLGEANIVHLLRYAGAHNDLLEMMLQSGVLGLAAFASTLLVPIVFFWRRRTAVEHDARLACELGICLATGVLICGLTNQMLSLKYLVSFYGLTMAGLAAQALGARRPAPDAGAS